MLSLGFGVWGLGWFRAYVFLVFRVLRFGVWAYELKVFF